MALRRVDDGLDYFARCLYSVISRRPAWEPEGYFPGGGFSCCPLETNKTRGLAPPAPFRRPWMQIQCASKTRQRDIPAETKANTWSLWSASTPKEVKHRLYLRALVSYRTSGPSSCSEKKKITVLPCFRRVRFFSTDFAAFEKLNRRLQLRTRTRKFAIALLLALLHSVGGIGICSNDHNAERMVALQNVTKVTTWTIARKSHRAVPEKRRWKSLAQLTPPLHRR